MPPLFRGLTGIGSLAALVALLFVPSFAPWVVRFDHSTADWRTAYLSDRLVAQHPRVALVVINDATLREYPSSPVDRGLLSRIVGAIDGAGARAIGLDILFFKATEEAKDQALVDALKTAKAEVVMGAVDERGELEGFQREFQSAFLNRVGRSVGYLNLRHERDDVVRYAAYPHPASTFPKSFARLLAAAGGSDVPDEGRAIPWLLPPKDGGPVFLTIPAQDLLAGGSAVAAKLKDRIVLVGGDFPLRDRHRTPLSLLSGDGTTGLAIHAHIVAGMLEPERAIAELSGEARSVLLIILGGLGFFLGWLLWQTNIVQFLGWTAATGALLAVDALLFKQMHVLLPFTLALLAWFLGVTAGRSLKATGGRFFKRRQGA